MSANIMIVEDDAVVLTYYRHHLKDLEKADIIECKSGAETLSALNEFIPDIVIMDYNLPDITGLELTSIIVMKHPSVIVIAISGEDRKDLEADMLELGAVSFLKKPVNSRVLYLTLQNFVEIVLSRKDRAASKSETKKNVEKSRKKTNVINEKSDQFIGSYCNTNISALENHLLTTKATPKTPAQFYNEMVSDYEYIDDFLDAVEGLTHSADLLYDHMSYDTLFNAASELENISRKLNFIQEFPSVAYSAMIMSENLTKLDYNLIEQVAFRKLCIFVYDYISLLQSWIKSVFVSRDIDDIHFMDFELIGFVMQMESIFNDVNVLSEDDSSAADEGGSIEFF